jgi:prepilin-type N-terminal cleavage/methylation domain-containing protein
MDKGFTLIELLVVIAIIAILSVVVILVLNPVVLLEQARDSSRISDLTVLNNNVNFVSQAGIGYGISLGSPDTVYVSIPDPDATSTVGDQCQGLGLRTLPSGWAYHCAASSTYRDVNGTGWVPINFTSLPGGSPSAALPVDPVNQTSSFLYYTYVTDGNGNYQIYAHFESAELPTPRSGSAWRRLRVRPDNLRSWQRREYCPLRRRHDRLLADERGERQHD